MQALFFASSRYWQASELQQAFLQLCALPCLADTDCTLVIDGQQPALQAGQPAVLVPLSGGVQRVILAAAAQFTHVTLFAAYQPGNYDARLTNRLLSANAAPAFMDCLAVLRRSQAVWAAPGAAQLADCLQAYRAAEKLKRSTLLCIGPKEPWVISAADELQAYQKLGLRLSMMPQEEIAALYAATTPAMAAEHLCGLNGVPCHQPNAEDKHNAARMSAALHTAMQQHNADALAIACFNLLKTGTTACWGVSRINTAPGGVAACEGDLDSAVTMLMLRELTDSSLWMANPALMPDQTVHYSHCTAPTCLHSGQPLPYELLSHHESGIGVSLQVMLPAERRVTACRYSAVQNAITAHLGTTRSGPPLPACRTQAYVSFDDPQHYLAHVLGCHQVLAFDEIAHKIALLGELLGLKAAIA